MLTSLTWLSQEFLIYFQWPSIDINEPCDSGNTALHAAVNKGNAQLVDILLESLATSRQDADEGAQRTQRDHHRLELDKPNLKCMNSTALHLAVWNDFTEIAVRLVQAGADPRLRMNDQLSVLDMAKENANQVLYELILEYSNQKTTH